MQKTQEMWVQSPGREDALEEGMATCSSILAWKIPQTEEPDGLQSDMTEHTHLIHNTVLRILLLLFIPLFSENETNSKLINELSILSFFV